LLGPYRDVCWDQTVRCVGTIQWGLLGPYRECVLGPYRAVYCDHTECVLGPYRAVCWDHTERCVGTIQWGVLGPYSEVCWDHTVRSVGTIQRVCVGTIQRVCVGTIQRVCVATIQIAVLWPSRALGWDHREGEVSALNGCNRERLNLLII
jgi:hypothetical protein